uniref:Guanylate cyclase n=1 Tax=Plectus sambesii TaxID=2011161 RepID=A0A914WMD0_9BILA
MTLMTWLPEYRQASLFWCTFVILAISSVSANELDVYEAILTNYNKNVRPVRNLSGPVFVSVVLLNFYLLHMDQKQETITFMTTLEMIWKDENIRWNASEFGGTSSVVIPSSLLWKPDITVYSGLNIEYMVPDEQRLVSVQSDGTIWSQSLCVITSYCPLSIENFPYDIQTCNITLGSWMYSIDQIALVIGNNLGNLNATIDDGNFKGIGEWKVLSFDSAVELVDVSNGQQYPYVRYVAQLQRQPIYYICVLLIPTFVTATICLLGLFAPAVNTGERVEKVNLGMTTLLAMGVILGIVAGEMPKSATLPLLGFYVLAELLLCTIGVILSMMIMVAHQRANTRVLIPPRWLNKILLLKMKAIQKPEKKNVTTVYTKKVFRQLNEDKEMNDLSEAIKNSIYAKRLNHVLARVEEYIDDKEFEEYILLQWILIFDRIDMFFLIVFNIANIVMSVILFNPPISDRGGQRASERAQAGMRSFSQLAFLLPLIFGRSYCIRTTIRVGNFIYLDEAPSRVYLNLTVDQIIRERLLPEDFDIELYHATGCDHFTAPNASFKLYTEQKVDVLLGPICSSGMEPVGLFAAGWDLPIMGVMSTGHSLTDKKVFPTLSRISITMDLIAEATVALLLRMGWHNIGLVSVADDDPFDTLYPQALKEYAFNHGVSIGVHQKILMNQNKDDRKQEMINALNSIKNAARIVIISLGMEIGDAREFLLLSEQMNMAGSSEYVFIVPWINHNPDQPLPWNFGDALDKAAGDIFGKVLTFVPAGYDDANLRKTIASTLRVSHLEIGNIERAMYLPNMHDSLYLYALCVNACLTDASCNWRSGRAIFEKARNRIFDGHSGRVIMSDTADRLADFAVLSAEAYNDSASSYQLITRFILEVSSNGQGRNQTWNLKTKNSFSWATIDGTQPPDTPECGFTGTNCGKLLSGETLGLISLTLLCLTIVISFALVRLKQWRFERNLLALSWSVPAAELNQRRATKEDNSSFLHDLETFTVPAGARQSVHMSDLSEDVSQSAESDDDPSGHSFSTIYRGQRVQVRRFRYRYQLDEVTKRHDLLKLKTIKDLNHENLAPFVGVVTDHPKNLMLVWGSADKGSLEFIVHNKER